MSKLWIVLLALVVAGCGGGGGGDGGGGGGGGGDSSGGGTTGMNPSGGGGTTMSGGGTDPVGGVRSALQSQLAACPNGLIVNERIPCIVGVFEGTTADTGAACAFVYDDEGIAFYIAGTATVRAELDSTTSGAMFQKMTASNSAGFAITWAIGVGSGNDIDVSYFSDTVPASASSLFVKPKDPSLPGCSITAGSSTEVAGAAETLNFLGRSWQAPSLLNGNGNVGVLADQPAFDAGIAEDGRAFVTFRQPDASGRMAVQVVEGRPAANGASVMWSAPQVLDATAPLLGTFRPRLAVSTTGHVVVAWMSELPCEGDAYERVPEGKTCRYLFASRRLATETAWEAPKRVRASPPAVAQDYYAQITFQGDVALVFPSFVFASPESSTYSDAAFVAIRNADEANYRSVELQGFNADPRSSDPFEQRVQLELDDARSLFAVGASMSTVPDLIRARATAAATAASDLIIDPARDAGSRPYQLQLSSGMAGYTWAGTRRKPASMTVYSPVTQQWIAGLDLVPSSLWGDTSLVGSDLAAGDLLIYSGCKLTSYVNGGFTQTLSLPPYCGRDRSGGVYAFNRNGDYIGVNWAGQPGQWGYYSLSLNRYLKGAPGSGATVSADFVLGTPSPVFGASPTQLLLTGSGLALAVTTNTFIELPSAANPLGMPGGSAQKLWAVYLQ